MSFSSDCELFLFPQKYRKCSIPNKKKLQNLKNSITCQKIQNISKHLHCFYPCSALAPPIPSKLKPERQRNQIMLWYFENSPDMGGIQ